MTAHRKVKKSGCHKTGAEEECDGSGGETELREAGEIQNKLRIHTAYSNETKEDFQQKIIYSVSC
jgi:hypothetical protein